MKVWLKAGVIIFYVLGYCFLRKRMRRDIVKLFKEHYNKNFIIDEMDMMDDIWKNVSFSEYDIIYHVAGIAHG